MSQGQQKQFHNPKIWECSTKQNLTKGKKLLRSEIKIKISSLLYLFNPKPNSTDPNTPQYGNYPFNFIIKLINLKVRNWPARWPEIFLTTEPKVSMVFDPDVYTFDTDSWNEILTVFESLQLHFFALEIPQNYTKNRNESSLSDRAMVLLLLNRSSYWRSELNAWSFLYLSVVEGSFSHSYCRSKTNQKLYWPV